MHRVLTLLLAQLLAVHTVFGCCAHHAHAYCMDGCELPAVEAASSAAHVHLHGDPLDRQQLVGQPSSHCDSQPGHRPHECQGRTCHYVSPNVTPAASLRNHLVVRLSRDNSHDADLTVVALVLGRALAPFPPGHLRDHLLLAVLLL